MDKDGKAEIERNGGGYGTGCLAEKNDNDFSFSAIADIIEQVRDQL